MELSATELRLSAEMKNFDGRGLTLPQAIARLAQGRDSLNERDINLEGSRDIRVEIHPNDGPDDGGPKEHGRRADGIFTEDSAMSEWLSPEGELALYHHL